MSITLEQIDLLKKRARVSYKEAKEVLEKCDGDIVEALAYLEENKKIKPEKEAVCEGTLGQKLKRVVARLNKISLSITKEETVILNLPLVPALLLTLISFPLVVVALILALITGCRIRIKRKNGEDCRINETIDAVADKINSLTNKVAEEIEKT